MRKALILALIPAGLSGASGRPDPANAVAPDRGSSAARTGAHTPQQQADAPGNGPGTAGSLAGGGGVPQLLRAASGELQGPVRKVRTRSSVLAGLLN